MENDKNSLSEMELKGKVKSMTVIFYDAKKIEKAGDLGQRDKIAYKEIKAFDVNGMMVEKREIGEDERLIAKQNYKFDDRRNILEMTWHRYDSGKISGNKATYIYDEWNNTIENCWYDINDHLTSKSIFSYDEHHNLMEMKTYDSNGKLNNTIDYDPKHLDKEGNWVNQYNISGSLHGALTIKKIKRTIEFYY